MRAMSPIESPNGLMRATATYARPCSNLLWPGQSHRAMLASAAIAGLLLAAGHAAAGPLPPQVNFVATPASQLRLGMTGDDVIRVMGKVVKETDFVGGSTRTRKLEFTDAIPGQALLSDGK